MKTYSKILALTVIASFFLFSCSKKTNDNEMLTTQDRTFISQASMGNTAEVKAAQLADSISTSAAVHAFAQQMITDHTTAQNDLKTLGNNVNVTVTDSVDALHQRMMDTLRTLSGPAFDSVYLIRQIADHQTVISQFQEEANSGNRTEVVDYANKYLPKLQMHLQVADSIAKAMNYE